MHAYRKLVEQEMTAKGWGQSDLAKRAGLDRQVVHRIVKDERDRLKDPPHASTVEGLANAFDLPDTAVWSAVAEAMGLPRTAAPSIIHEVTGVSNEELIKELARRMDLEVTVRSSGTTPSKEARKGKKMPATLMFERDDGPTRKPKTERRPSPE